MLDRLTRDQANAVYDILVEECGATDPLGHERTCFVYDMTNAHRFKDFRFTGALGFGGRFHMSGSHSFPYVDCYGDDETPERLMMILRANERIVALFNSVVTP